MHTKITLKNMVFYGYHGAFAAERELGQRIEVDVELYGDFAPAGRNDDLDLTVNYVDIYTIAKEIVEEKEFSLLEAIGIAIADQITVSFGLDKVIVRVRKPHPPLGGAIDYTEFEVEKDGESSLRSNTI